MERAARRQRSGALNVRMTYQRFRPRDDATPLPALTKARRPEHHDGMTSHHDDALGVVEQRLPALRGRRRGRRGPALVAEAARRSGPDPRPAGTTWASSVRTATPWTADSVVAATRRDRDATKELRPARRAVVRSRARPGRRSARRARPSRPHGGRSRPAWRGFPGPP